MKNKKTKEIRPLTVLLETTSILILLIIISYLFSDFFYDLIDKKLYNIFGHSFIQIQGAMNCGVLVYASFVLLKAHKSTIPQGKSIIETNKISVIIFFIIFNTMVIMRLYGDCYKGLKYGILGNNVIGEYVAIIFCLGLWLLIVFRMIQLVKMRA